MVQLTDPYQKSAGCAERYEETSLLKLDSSARCEDFIGQKEQFESYFDFDRKPMQLTKKN